MFFRASLKNVQASKSFIKAGLENRPSKGVIKAGFKKHYEGRLQKHYEGRP